MVLDSVNDLNTGTSGVHRQPTFSSFTSKHKNSEAFLNNPHLAFYKAKPKVKNNAPMRMNKDTTSPHDNLQGSNNLCKILYFTIA